MHRSHFLLLASLSLVASSVSQLGMAQEIRQKLSPTPAKTAGDDKNGDARKQTSKPKIEKTELAALVKKLSDDLDDVKQAVRDKAESQLFDLGPSVIEFLPPATPDVSPEWATRMDRLRSKLEAAEIDEFTSARLVTLSGSMTARKALMQIAADTGNTITLDEQENLNREVITDFDETPFWEAFDEVLDQVEMTVAGGDGEVIQLVPRAQRAPLRIATAGYSGVFRIEPLSVQKNYLLHDPGRSSVQLQFLLSWEPRLHPVFVKFPMEAMELQCDNGEVLPALISSDETEFVPAGGSQMQVTLDFGLPSREAKKIVRWNGKVFVAIPGIPATVEFGDLVNAQKVKTAVGNLTVTLEKTRKNRDIHEALLSLALSGKEQSSESFRGWSSTHETYLLDSKNERVENVGWSTTHMTENEIGLSYLFDIEKGLEGCKLIVRAPSSVIDQTFDFSLEDVPLP